MAVHWLSADDAEAELSNKDDTCGVEEEPVARVQYCI